MPELTFNPELHEYRIDGQVVPSVTQILSEAGLVDDRWYTDESQLRGRTVHIITALDDRGELDESQVDAEYRGYLNAWRLFKAETKCEILSIEERICNVALRYAGTLDRRIRWNGPVHIGDLKTGACAWWHPFQTAGYWMCDGIDAASRLTVYLTPDGTWRSQVYERHSHDTDVFRAALVIANAKRNEGKTNDRDRN
jgi:hypothetical protein